MYRFIRTSSANKDFKNLVRLLDIDLAERDGKDHSFFAQFNKIDAIKYVVVIYDEHHAIGCGAIKEYAKDTVEVKRMFVSLENRGKGIASKVLLELEKWAKELGYTKCILETGERQPEAISLYKKNNYSIIKNYGQYAEVKTSVCFEKQL